MDDTNAAGDAPVSAERAAWIRRTAAVMTTALAEHGYSAEQCEVLAGVMHDLEITPQTLRREGLTPRTILRQSLLEMQDGIKGDLAVTLARTMRAPDYSRLMMPPRTAADLLEVVRARLGDYREYGLIEPAVDHRQPHLTGGQQLWWLDDVLLMMADARNSAGMHGRGTAKKRFPNL